MDYKLSDLIDIQLFQSLQDRLDEIYSFPSSIIDNDGNILTATAWQDACTKFHRANKECELECLKSDQYIKDHLHEANPAISYCCPHGLIDNATPIIINGKHYGNYFTGQLFLEPPDIEFFKQQAKKYNFDEEAYLQAIKKVPIWSKEQLNNYLFFIKGLIEVMAGIGLKNLKDIDTNKKIKESEERYMTIIKTSHDGFWMVSKDDRLLEVNNAYCKMSGYSREELLEMKIHQLDAIDREEIVLAKTNKMKIEGGGIFESMHKRKDGSLFAVEISVTYLPEGEGIFYVFIRDISQRKNAEEALRKNQIKLEQQNEEYLALNEELNESYKQISKINKELKLAIEKAEESDRLKSAFLQNMSHEVRTPLNAIVGFSNILSKPNLAPEKLQIFSNLISSSSERLIGIITDVIEISQIQANQIQSNLMEIDIIQFVSYLVLSYTEKAKEKNIALKLHMNIPFKEYKILSDFEKLKRMLSHVIDNALKFTPYGKVEITCGIVEKNVQISIFDTGIGISKEMQKVIFEPFRQVEIGTCRNYGGNGLGLSIVKAYAELLKGSILLTSEINKGTNFIVSIPANKAQIKVEQSVLATTIYSIKTILIVEDEYSNYQYLLELLDEYDFEILYAKNGQQAIDLCKANKAIDLILMDIKMPILDGHTAAKLIKAFRSDLPIIAQTAYALESEMNAYSNDFDDYITKPIDEGELKQKLQKFMHKNVNA